MPAKSKTRILVVEDDATIRLTISKLLSDEGYDVSSATDGFALMHLREAVPNLILCDLNMPQMSGFELLSVVRRRFPEILVLASSGAYGSSDIPTGVIADALYAKGQESASELLEIIARLLRTRAAKHKEEGAPVWIPRKRQRPQRQALRSSNMYRMPEVVSVNRRSRTHLRGVENFLHLLSS